MEQIQGVISRAGERTVLSQQKWNDGGEQEGSGAGAKGEHQKIPEKERNPVSVEFGSQSCNEGFARMVAAAYVAQFNPTMEEISDVKTAVSEAVTNAVIHGYRSENGIIRMQLSREGDGVTIEVSDCGEGIENVLLAMEPMYTTRPDMERSGMGFAFMEAFMDELEVRSSPGHGTVVRMKKKIASPAQEE